MKLRSSLVAAMAAAFAGAVSVSPSAAHDGRNAALIGGLIAGALIGVAAANAQGDNPRPRYYYGGGPQRYPYQYGYRPGPPGYYAPQYCGRYPYPPCY